MMKFMQKRREFFRFFNVIIIVFSLMLAACTKSTTSEVNTRFSGDHTTEQIRGMWWICFTSRQKVAPYLPPAFNVEHCDCVIDKSRERYSSEDYELAGQDNLTRFFTELNIECAKPMSTEVRLDEA